jgi:predicted butyrate kinase (DUF1464 family)
MSDTEQNRPTETSENGTRPGSAVAGGCAQAITEVLTNVRSRLREKRDMYRRCKDIDSMSSSHARAKENAVDNAIVIVEQFLSTYREEHE